MHKVSFEGLKVSSEGHKVSSEGLKVSSEGVKSQPKGVKSQSNGKKSRPKGVKSQSNGKKFRPKDKKFRPKALITERGHFVRIAACGETAARVTQCCATRTASFALRTHADKSVRARSIFEVECHIENNTIDTNINHLYGVRTGIKLSERSLLGKSPYQHS
jgi:hypothetical protein